VLITPTRKNGLGQRQKPHKCCRCGIYEDYDEYPEKSDIKAWAHIDNDKCTFSYGLSGTFRLREAITPHEEHNSDKLLLCNRCLSNIGYDPYYDVECKRCHVMYQRWFHSEKGGFGCNSEIKTSEGKYYIYGWYGSKYDMNSVTFNVSKLPDNLNESDMICDNCIDSLCQKGVCTHNDRYKSDPRYSIPIHSVMP
jgi:hypothetical protein